MSRVSFSASAVAALVCVLALTGLGLPGAGVASGAPARPPVVLIVMDEFPTVALMKRSGGISASRFPNFHRLSREGVWYRNHTTVSSLTRNSVPGILSGNIVPVGDTYATTENYPASLFTHLRANGYKVEALESATQICPVKICPLPAGRLLDPAVFANSIDFQNAKVRQTWEQTRGGLINWARHQKFKRGSFIFRHFLMPHHPYDHLPSGQNYSTGPIPSVFSASSPTVTAPTGNIRLSYQRLLLQVGYVDRMIGEVRKAARRQGNWKSMMLVVVGDHGLEHQPGRQSRVFEADNAGSIAFTPLFVKYPAKTKGGTSNLPTRGIDVFPTIARALGTGVPDVAGKPIADLAPTLSDVTVDGQQVSFSAAERNRQRAVVFRDRLLGTGGLFKMGLATHLIGRKAGGRPSGKVRLDDPSRYRSVDRQRGSTPALISGTAPTLRSGAVVAVSVNGKIRGTAEVFADRGRRRFGAMVNPRFFRKKNEIGVHLVKKGRLVRRLR